MSKNHEFDIDKSIEETIKSALSKGDFSELKNLGPAIQKSVNTALFGQQSRDGIPYSTPQSPSSQGGPTHNGMPQNGASPNTSQSGVNPAGQAHPHASYPPPHAQAAQAQPVQSRPSYHTAPVPRAIKRRMPRGILQIVFGAIIDFFFVPITLAVFAYLLTVTAWTEFVFALVFTLGFAAVAATGAALLIVGIRKNGLARRALQLSTILQGKKVCNFDELAAITGRTPKQIKRDLKKIQKMGVFPEIYTDENETCVMWGEDTYRQYLQSEEARQKKLREEENRRTRLENPATADIEHFRREGENFILKIRTANDVLTGEEISTKLDVLEDTTKRIITYVERYPEKLPETRKFVNHYLPTTLKLVEKYHQYDRMDFEPENVRQTKAEIERSLDTINVAFNNLLESLFVHDTLDVTTDIKVLENMLEQEGLIGNTFKIDQPGSSPNMSL